MNNIEKIKPSGIFTNYIFKTIPLAFDESMSYYETLCGVLSLLKTQEEVVNNNADLLAELESYVQNYFKNLDVQTEINNKLDEMAKSGELENIIASYINSNALIIFDNVESMKNSTDLINGSTVKTLGYYEKSDGGSAIYKIRTVTTNDVVDEMFIIKINDTLIAELIYKNEINTKQVGFIGDNTTNETNKMNILISKLKDNFVINVIGKILIDSVSIGKNEILKNITFKGINGLIGYGNDDVLENGFTINSTENYTKKYGIEIKNIKGFLFENLIIESNEIIEDGGLPLNGLYGILMTNSPYSIIENCSIRKFFIGIYNNSDNSSSGLQKIKNNNISLCNVGIWFSNTGDSIIENNYINTLGWNIYQDDNYNLKEKYNQLKNLGMVHGKAIYMSGGGANSIKGGKIEYCNAGIYIDVTNNLNINNIVFDRCNSYGIAIDSATYKWTKLNINIDNSSFIGCGNNISQNSDLDGNCISINRNNYINISNCSFKASDENYQDNFVNTDKKFYAPKNGFIKAVYSKFINVSNCVFSDNLYAIIPFHSIINISNLSSLQTGSYDSSIGNTNNNNGFHNNTLLSDNTNNLTLGNFTLGDKLIKAYTNGGFYCSDNGSLGTIENQTCNVLNGTITDGNLTFTANNNYLLLNNYNGDLFGELDYINIEGVTGDKRIMQIVYVPSSNHYYAKLNSSCDVIVTNANLSFKTPSFIEF